MHFPVALLTIASFLVSYRHWRGRDDLETFIGPSLALSVATFPLVFLAGLRDAGWSELWTELVWSAPLIWHAIVGTLTIVTYTIYFVVRQRWVATGNVPVNADVGFAISGFWLLLMTGLIAGEMVFG